MTLTEVTTGLGAFGVSRSIAAKFFSVAAGRDADMAQLAAAAAAIANFSNETDQPDEAVGISPKSARVLNQKISA